jgi:predicted phosphoribosyltransferase
LATPLFVAHWFEERGALEESCPWRSNLVSEKPETTTMRTQFHDREEAGRLLAEKLIAYANRPDVLVLALPRGGVPVAAQVAKELNAPLDVFVVRKLGFPGHPELAMGAIATGGIRVLNPEVVDSLHVPGDVIEAVTVNERDELKRRERAYRDDLPAPDVRGKTVILVDDGIATGSTMLAAVAALRQVEAGRIVVSAPTIASTTFDLMRDAADEVAVVIVPEEFYGVGQSYEDFSQTTDEEVRELLDQSNRRVARLL